MSREDQPIRPPRLLDDLGRVADHLAGQGLVLSAATAGQVLAQDRIRPHKVRGWLNRADAPPFWARAGAVCRLYLNPPPGTALISVDEKTGIQARSRKHPQIPAGPGRDARREFECARHGTISIIAAMNVATGEVVTERIARNDSATFTRFLAMLHQIIPPHLRIHLIMDNGSSRTSRATRAWLTAHPRFAVTYTPKHASWLNMVELGTVHGAWLPAAHTPAVLALMLCPGWLAAMMLSWLICAPRANRNHPPVR